MKKPKIIRITTVPESLRGLLKGQHYFMSGNGFEVVGVSSNGEQLQEVAIEEQIRVKAIEMSRKITPLQDLKSLWQMYWFLKKEKPEIVHSHTPKAGTIGMMAAKLAGVPYRLHTIAGLPLMEATGKKRYLLNVVEKLTYACATKIYPNSKGLYDFILEQKFTSKNKLKVIANGSSNGINIEHFNPKQVNEVVKTELKELLGIKHQDFVFIFVGRLVSDKGINELVSAFMQLNNKTEKSVKLLLVGSEERGLDPLDEKTIMLINEDNNIISVGYQNDVRPYFSIADVLTFPSYREGFPNVVMQAGAMGLPSIVSNINGCNEIIEENKNGFIIPVKNSDALYEAMLKMMLNSDMKLKAREMITTRFEQKTVWDALLNEYKNSLLNNV
ncbi:glycosyltransferase family 4 protein [Tenacibaculum finnmarkense]|uniref:glycosyltransferase family 4 protein n=1 Tax=Tenacibaculum finnmarkense TaxID=2781243 RepID=UPI001EFA2D95|nr:glycosyltransferase family 4 protein [Tenacibaculum finnmarkense]MCG8236937.1 glycosyltransferase family 4 protein [Tenacibaculum finnmarkense genomovar ulcerans]